MIPISEVLEACWSIVRNSDCREEAMDQIDALAAKYEKCIVAEDAPDAWMSPNMEILAPVRHDTVFGSHTIALYRAKEPK